MMKPGGRRQTPEYKVLQNSGELDKTVTRTGGKGPNEYGNLKNYLPRKIEQVEEEYVSDTAILCDIYRDLISKSEHFLDGEARHKGKIEDAIYLDKSARNVNNIVKELWSILTKQPNDEIPKASFINIDKGRFLVEMGFPAIDTEHPDLSQISLDRLTPEFRKKCTQSIRALYLSPEDLAKLDENNPDEVWQYPTILDGKRVAIIDEVRSYSATLRIADMLIQEAIPEARLEPITWSVPMIFRWSTLVKGELKNNFAVDHSPVWYDEASSEGRGGIDDLKPELLEKSPDKRKRLGRHVLSIIRDEMDQMSKDLLTDFSLLAQRLKDGHIIYRPRTKEVHRMVEAYYGVPFSEVIPMLKGKITPEEFAARH